MFDFDYLSCSLRCAQAKGQEKGHAQQSRLSGQVSADRGNAMGFNVVWRVLLAQSGAPEAFRSLIQWKRSPSFILLLAKPGACWFLSQRPFSSKALVIIRLLQSTFILVETVWVIHTKN